MLHREQCAYAYDFRNRLTGVSIGGVATATYTYDPLDRRIGVQDNGTQTWTVYDGQNPYADFNGSGSLQQRYLYGPAVDQVLARTDSGGTTAWYLTDRLGTVRSIASSTGSVIDHVVYDSFGNITSESGGGGDRFKFTGREYDAAVGLYYYRARQFDPVVGRFTLCDPLGFNGSGANLYNYTGNSPSNSIDGSGLYPVKAGTLECIRSAELYWSDTTWSKKYNDPYSKTFWDIRVPFYIVTKYDDFIVPYQPPPPLGGTHGSPDLWWWEYSNYPIGNGPGKPPLPANWWNERAHSGMPELSPWYRRPSGLGTHQATIVDTPTVQNISSVASRDNKLWIDIIFQNDPRCSYYGYPRKIEIYIYIRTDIVNGDVLAPPSHAYSQHWDY